MNTKILKHIKIMMVTISAIVFMFCISSFNSYAETADIIPYNNGENDPPDSDYVEVNFNSGMHTEERIGEWKYFVNKTKNITVGDLDKPEIQTFAGYPFDGWDTSDSTEITENMNINPKYILPDNVVPSNNGENERPYTHFMVTFSPQSSGSTVEFGSITSGETVYYVKRNEGITLAQLTKPEVTPNNGTIFTGWNLDDSTTITRNLEVNARYDVMEKIIPSAGGANEKPTGYITVQFKEGEHGTITSGETMYYVNPQPLYGEAVELRRLTMPEVMADENYIFDDWDKNRYMSLEEDTIVTAKWLPYIIPSNNDYGINECPSFYEKVTFDAGQYGSLNGENIWYVSDRAEPKIKIGDLRKPEVIPKVGYKFERWSQVDETIINWHISVHAFYEFVPDIVPSNGGTNEKPEGYITVAFKSGENGTITSGETIYYVNPERNLHISEITPPEITASPSYSFQGWDKYGQSVRLTEDVEVTAKYMADIIPSTNSEYTEEWLVESLGYAKVTFDAGDNGTIASGETIYYVKPGKGITLGDLEKPTVVPNIGYEVSDWLYDDERLIRDDIHLYFRYDTLDRIIPWNGGENEKPTGYVTVTFKPGENGSILSGETVYYVNPERESTLSALTKPIVEANSGYIINGWSKQNTEVLDEDMDVIVQYIDSSSIVSSNNGTTSKPEGYITVVFKAGENGSVTSGETTYYINPTKAVTLGSLAKPVITGNQGYTAYGWDKTDETTLTEDTEVLATYLSDIIPYSDFEEIAEALGIESDEEFEQVFGDYLVVEFDLGKDGDIVTGEYAYIVNGTKGLKLSDLIKPTVTFGTGYLFDGWYESDETVLTFDHPDAPEIEIRAKCIVLSDVIESNNGETSKPEGYVTVVFQEGENGRLTGETTYYINPEKELTLQRLLKPQVVANTGYVSNGWNKSEDTEITEDMEIIANYMAIEANDIIQDNNGENTKPEGYITVAFKPGTNGTLTGETIYYINPNKGLTLASLEKPKVAVTETIGYVFDGWDIANERLLNEDIEVTAQYRQVGGSVIRDNIGLNVKPAGYITVEFKSGTKGTLTGETKYYVHPEKGFSLSFLAKPGVTAIDGYEFDGWDKEDMEELTIDMEVTAQYRIAGSSNTSGTTVTPDTSGTSSNAGSRSHRRSSNTINEEVKEETDKKEKSVEEMTQEELEAYVQQPPQIINGSVVERRLPLERFNTVSQTDLRLEKTNRTAYMRGYENGTFRPNANITRGEIATVLTNIVQVTENLENENVRMYKDMSKAQWYDDAIGFMTKHKVLSGYPDGDFRPNSGLTRAEFATLISKFIFLEGAEKSERFKDVDGTYWANKYIASVKKMGIMRGYPDGSFMPEKLVTRGEVANIVNKILQRQADVSFIDKSNQLKKYSDDKHWAYYDIQMASNSYKYELKDGVEKWTQIEE